MAPAAAGQSTPAPSSAQGSLPIAIVRDPQAVTLLSNTAAALATLPVTDVTVQASVHWIKGSDDETVTATFLSAGPQTSQATFNLSDGAFVEARNQLAAAATNAGNKQTVPLHNTLNLHEWFFPAFFIADLLHATGYSLATPVASTINGESVETIQGSFVPTAPMDAGTAQILMQATQFELVLDGTTDLPVSLSFVGHPEDDALRGYPVVYQFSQYQQQSGVQTPMRIEKYVQGSLTLDVTVQSVAINIGVSASQFAAQ